MSRDFDQEIAAQEARMANIRQQMEVARREFESAVAEMIRPWYVNQTDTMVKRKSEVTKSLGKEKLGTLKRDLADLQAKADKIAREVFADKTLWWHEQPNNQFYSVSTDHRPKELDEAIRLVGGRLGLIFEKFGYLSKDYSSTAHEVWREWDRSGNRHPYNARPYYPGGRIDWTDRMLNAVKSYADAHSMMQSEQYQLSDLQRQKGETEAEDLWRDA